MKNSTTSTLVWLTAILCILGLLIKSPSGYFFAFVLAALSGLITAISGSKKIRITAVTLLFKPILLEAVKYLELQKEQKTIHGKSLKIKN